MFDLYKKYKYTPWLLYFPLYLLIFTYLERINVHKLHLITSWVDYYIPFCEWFIIPYLLWFTYIAATVAYLFFYNQLEFHRFMCFLCIGMSVFLIISAIYPTAQNLRPTLSMQGSILTDMVRCLYQIDTPTNVFPSIHVFNSIGAYIAVCRVTIPQKHAPLRFGCLSLSILIILSTMFLKQHSLIDVVGGTGLALFCYYLIYCREATESKKVQIRSGSIRS